ncbi:MAG: hypothetical protein P4L22_03555 [Candidatus Babeliales bacterium]|nr:hypothetical protein [Candidatus Babeliales bacterium]
MKLLNKNLLMFLLMGSSYINGMHLVQAAKQVAIRTLPVIARSYSKAAGEGLNRVNACRKQVVSVPFKGQQFGFSKISTNYTPCFNELEYCADKSIEIAKNEKSELREDYYDEYMRELKPSNSEYISYAFNGNYVSLNKVLRSKIYFKNRLSYLDYLIGLDLIKFKFAKYVFYRAIEFKDYKMVIILLKLGINPYQKIEINEKEHRLIDLFDNNLKIILSEMIKKNKSTTDEDFN